MKIIQRPQAGRAIHTGFSIPRIFTVALVASLLGLACMQSFGAVAQQAYVKASNTRAEFAEPEHFGTSVAIWGDTMVVGAPRESSGGRISGAAYIYVRNGTNWTSQAFLKASDSQLSFNFGSAVSIWSNTVVIGDPGYSDGDGRFGAAYVFVRNGAVWSEQAKLRPSNVGCEFGMAVCVWSNTIVVGDYCESSDGIGVNGSPSPYDTPLSGAAYIFERSGGTWSQQAYLKASNAEADDEFGVAVGISGDTVVVGARGEDSNATLVNGNPADNSNADSGAAYVFVRSGGAWTQQSYLKASSYSSSQAFGSSIAVSGDTVVIGAPDESGGASGVNGNPFGEPKFESGAVFVFTRNGTAWTQQAYLKASNTGERDHFGCSVALAGDSVVVGARDEDSNAAGVNGNPSSNSATNSGAAYLFSRIGTNWFLSDYLKASNPGGGTDELLPADAFGSSVGISGDTMAIGAPGEASNAIGVNGNQGDNSLVSGGAAYVFVPSLTFSGYSSTPPAGSRLDLGVIEGEVTVTLFIGNVGPRDLQITSVEFIDNPVDAKLSLATCDTGFGFLNTCPATLPFHIPSGPAGGLLRVYVRWDSERKTANLDQYLRVICDDPVMPIIDYRVTAVRQPAFVTTFEGSFITWLYRNFPTAPSGGFARPKALVDLPQTATFTLEPSAPHSVNSEIPAHLGGGSVTLSNFAGSFTVSLQAIPNDTNRVFLQVESGSFTAPSFTLPSGLVSGPNVLTFGPPEQSSGLLYLTNGYYEVAATATITNSLIPNGVTVRGNYTGLYNVTNDQVSLQSDSRDLFVASERVQLNHAPNGLWLTWANTNAVEEATDVTGPWRTVTNAVSPYLVITTNLPQQFFRLGRPEP